MIDWVCDIFYAYRSTSQTGRGKLERNTIQFFNKVRKHGKKILYEWSDQSL